MAVVTEAHVEFSWVLGVIRRVGGELKTRKPSQEATETLGGYGDKHGPCGRVTTPALLA